jgi:hypothetical protein
MRGRSSGRPAVSSASPCNADESVWSAVLMAQVWSAVECRHRDRLSPVLGHAVVDALGTRCRHSSIPTPGWRLGRGHGAPSGMAGRHRSRRGAVAARRLVAASVLCSPAGPRSVVLGLAASVAATSLIPPRHGAVGYPWATSSAMRIRHIADFMQLLHCPGRPWYQPEREPAPHDRRRHIAHGSGLADRGDPPPLDSPHEH